ncbi:SEC-C metal-binding domain-containing protein, partial [Lutispora thermophila]
MLTQNTCPCGSGQSFGLCCGKKYKSIQNKANMDINTASKYDLWSYTRFGLYQAIAKQLNQISKEDNRNIIILGAGSCMDLPMDYICDNFSEIVLVDI